jgi:hypothetical protein
VCAQYRLYCCTFVVLRTPSSTSPAYVSPIVSRAWKVEGASLYWRDISFLGILTHYMHIIISRVAYIIHKYTYTYIGISYVPLRIYYYGMCDKHLSETNILQISSSIYIYIYIFRYMCSFIGIILKQNIYYGANLDRQRVNLKTYIYIYIYIRQRYHENK